MTTLSFSFENSPVRTVGSDGIVLFIANDIAVALGYQKPANAVAQHVYTEDIVKQEIVDSLGRKQTVNCVNESGMYALIFGSKLDSAKRFKRWVTAEVLPAIRKTGRYDASATLSTEEQYEIRKAVKSRAKNSSVHYQTIYNALYDYFKVASYKDLTKAQFAPAITFVQTCDVAPQLEQSVPEGSVVLSKDEAEGLRAFVYCWRYLFRPELEAFGAFLRVCHAPKAGRFREAVHDFNMAYFESILDRHGYAVKDLPCYQHLMSH